MRRLFKVGVDRHDRGKVVFAWHPDGNYLASAGRNDRHGDIVDEVPLQVQSPIVDLKWDKDGELLSILQEGNQIIPLWALSSRKVTQLDTNLKDPTFMEWSRNGPQLAVGTQKGNLLIYNKSTKKRIPIVGLHAKRISCGCWSKTGNRLALGSDDKSVTVSDENGDTLLHSEVKMIPQEAIFMSLRSKNNDTDTLSAILDGKTVYLLDILNDKEDPLELSFATDENNKNKCKYGDIRHIEIFDETILIVGFSQGFILTVPACGKNLGQELNLGKFHSNSLSTFSYNPVTNTIASAGDDGIRIIDMKDFKESRAEFVSIDDLENGKITSVQWSPDGQILSVATSTGNIYNFLAKMSIINATCYNQVAYLSSLREVSITDISKPVPPRPTDIDLQLEPGLIALGPLCLVAGMNNKLYFHATESYDNYKSGEIINEREYAGTVRDVKLNSKYVAVLIDNKAIVHLIDPHTAPSGAPNKKSMKNKSESKSGESKSGNNGIDDGNRETVTFPVRDEGSYGKLTCIAITENFLFYGTEAGTVEVFSFDEWTLLSGAELRIQNSIKQIYPNPVGTRLVVLDNTNNIILYNPITGGVGNISIVQFDAPPSIINNCLWDSSDRNIIMLFDGKFIHTYIYTQYSINGSCLVKLGPLSISSEGSILMEPNKIEMVGGNIPVTTFQGKITCQTVTGGLLTMIHPYFDKLNDILDPKNSPPSSPMKKVYGRNSDLGNIGLGNQDQNVLMSRFCQALGLSRLETAWQTALLLDRKEIWLSLGGKALELLNVDLGIRVYRQLKDAGMVMCLESLVHIEDQLLLSGHIALLFNDYNRAQELFLASSQPEAALQMRRDLLQWENALKLARALASTQLPDVCVHYAQQLENKDDIDTALRLFESALLEQDMNGKIILPVQPGTDIHRMASSGVARCNLRLGNIRQGIKSANEINNVELFQECGDILEQQKQYQEAADMHLKANQHERAAFIYIKYLIKNDKNKVIEAAKILESVRNDQLNHGFAKVCMNMNKYEEAMEAYSRAKDLDKVVEIKLRHLDQIQDAFDIVRHFPSELSAQLVADYCLEINNIAGAIEFLLLCNKSEEAYKLAQSNNMVETYASYQGDTMTSEEALKIAQYFEKNQNFGKAGKFYSLCQQYARALKLFMQCGDKEIDAAIDVVGKSQNETLTHQLIDFLVGETDGIPKDSNYIYKLYIALKKYDDAGKTALIISSQEQEIGNYTLAHTVLFETAQFLEEAKVKVPQLLRQRFVLLHSYILVKMHVRSGDHVGAARLLYRVAQNVSKFPQHVVPILTSAVIECQRANMKASCYDFALQLMKPEYRSTIDVNLKRKIEAIVRRKTAQNEELEDTTSKCPICGLMIADYQLECPTTRDALPMCVVTGKHMVLDDWTFCPVSKAPALYSEYKKYIQNYNNVENGSTTSGNETIESSPDRQKRTNSESPIRTTGVPLDPVLGKPVNIEDIVKVSSEEATKYIKRYNNVLEEKKKTNETIGNNGESDGTNNTSMESGGGDENNGKESLGSQNNDKSPLMKQTSYTKTMNPRFRTKKINVGK